jgi:hypothetical protein
VQHYQPFHITYLIFQAQSVPFLQEATSVTLALFRYSVIEAYFQLSSSVVLCESQRQQYQRLTMSTNFQKGVLLLALGGTAWGIPMPQGVTVAVSPAEKAPAECKADGPGAFNLAPADASSSARRRDAPKVKGDKIMISKNGAARVKRAGEGEEEGEDNDVLLECQLEGGIIKDQQKRTGYIASNYQYV